MAGDYDAIVIGAGHNGLISACLLARAGARTVVLERRARIGGCTDTSAPWPEHPDWKVNTYSYVAGLMPRAIIRDVGLDREGLTIMPYGAYVVPFADGRVLELHHDTARACASIARFSKKDAETYPRWEAWLERIADVVWPLFTQVPANLGSMKPRDLVATGRMAWQMRRLGVRGAADLTRLFTLSAREILDEWFESEEVKGALAMTATVGAYGGPDAPGTAYVLLHLTMGDPGDGHVGGWGFVRGGMGGLANACRRAAEAAGAEVRTGAGVASIVARGGRVAGVVLDNGDELRAPVVVSSAHPKLTFLELVGRELLPPDFVADIERFRCRGGSIKINLALGELPRFPAMEAGAEPASPAGAAGPREYHTHAIELGYTPAYVQAAFDDADAGRPAAHPIADGTLPSVVDDTLMPAGLHCMSIYSQWVPDEWHKEPHQGRGRGVRRPGHRRIRAARPEAQGRDPRATGDRPVRPRARPGPGRRQRVRRGARRGPALPHAPGAGLRRLPHADRRPLQRLGGRTRRRRRERHPRLAGGAPGDQGSPAAPPSRGLAARPVGSAPST